LAMDKKVLKDIILTEMATNNVIRLYKYLRDGKEKNLDDLAFIYVNTYPLFKRFYGEILSDIDIPDVKNEIELRRLKKDNPQIYEIFIKYLLKRIEHRRGDLTIAPIWAIYDDPGILDNRWLIHFTDKALDIAKSGFYGGVSNFKKLAYTKYAEKNDRGDGDSFFFAFDAKDALKYGETINKYGSDAVMFRASGVRVYHIGDEEHQVIFQGDTVSNIVPLFKQGSKWTVKTCHGKKLFEGHLLERTVKWLKQNYDQYRKTLYFQNTLKSDPPGGDAKPYSTNK
jgi:hypothetical protein